MKLASVLCLLAVVLCGCGTSTPPAASPPSPAPNSENLASHVTIEVPDFPLDHPLQPVDWPGGPIELEVGVDYTVQGLLKGRFDKHAWPILMLARMERDEGEGRVHVFGAALQELVVNQDVTRYSLTCARFERPTKAELVVYLVSPRKPHQNEAIARKPVVVRAKGAKTAR